jgi:hypothetical protein
MTLAKHQTGPQPALFAQPTECQYAVFVHIRIHQAAFIYPEIEQICNSFKSYSCITRRAGAERGLMDRLFD